MSLTPLDPSCKWNHTVCVFLWLAYSTQYNVLKVHLCSSMWQDWFPSFLRLVFHSMHIYLAYPFFLSCCQLLDIVNNSAMNIYVQISLQDLAFNFSDYIPKRGIAGSNGQILCLKLMRNPHTILHSGCTCYWLVWVFHNISWKKPEWASWPTHYILTQSAQGFQSLHILTC